MGFQTNFISGTSVTISGGVGFPTPATGQTFTYFYSHDNGLVANTPETLYTVTATKTFYLTQLSVSASIQCSIFISDNATDMITCYYEALATGGCAKQFTFPVPIPFSHSVVIESGQAPTVNVFGTGWEQ